MADINNLIKETMEKHRQYEEREKQRATEQRKVSEQIAEDSIRETLAKLLSPELLEQVQFCHYYRHQYYTATAYIHYGEYNWHMSEDNRGRWSIYTSNPRSNGAVYSRKGESIKGECLQTALLVEIGKYDVEVQQKKAEHVELERQNQIVDKNFRKHEEERKREQQENIAKVVAEHERLTAIFNAEKERAKLAMWQWPKGVTIEIFFMEYAKGSYISEDEEASFDYETGWTTVDHLDAQGRIHIEAGRDSNARTVKLSMRVHRPTWTIREFSSIETLPRSLRKPIKVGVSSIIKRYYQGEQYLMEQDPEHPLDHYSEEIGEEPLKWIKNLIDQAKER